MVKLGIFATGAKIMGKNSEISEISEKIQRVAKLSRYVKMFDKSLKLTQLKQIK